MFVAIYSPTSKSQSRGESIRTGMAVESLMSRDDAKKFLQTFEQRLSAMLPQGRAIEAEIRNIIADAKANTSKKHLRLPEAVLLNHYVLPILYEELQAQAGLSADDAKRALLNEYHRSMPDISQRSPISACAGPWRTRFRSDGGQHSGGMTDHRSDPMTDTLAEQRNAVRHGPGTLSGMRPESEH